MRLIYEIERGRQEFCPRDPAEAAPRAGAFSVFLHIVYPDAVTVDYHRHRVSAVVFDRAGRGMIGTDNDDTIPDVEKWSEVQYRSFR